MIKITSNEILASKGQNDKCYVDIAKSIAEHGTRLLWGQGFEYTDKNEERKRVVQELFVENRAADLFRTVSNLMSLYGRCLVVIDYIENKPKLHVVDMASQCKVGMAWANETGAVYWYRPIQDDLNHIVKVTSSITKNVYTAYANGEQISIDTLNEKLPESQQIPKEWKHNLGFVPCIQMTNKDYYIRNIQTYEYLQLADCFNVRDLLPAVNYQIGEMILEAGMSHTRAYGSFSITTLREMAKNGTTPEAAIMKRAFIDQGTTDSGNKIEIQQSNFDGETRWNVVNMQLDRIMYESGYSPVNDTNREQTATEVLFSKARDIETTKQKRNRMQFYITELLKKCFVITGHYTKEQYHKCRIEGDEDWTFEIKENMVLNSIAMSEELYNMFERDQISYVEMIGKLRDISIEEAETIADEIMKSNNEIKAEQLKTMTDATMPQEGDNLNEAENDQVKKDSQQQTESTRKDTE